MRCLSPSPIGGAHEDRNKSRPVTITTIRPGGPADRWDVFSHMKSLNIREYVKYQLPKAHSSYRFTLPPFYRCSII